VQRYFNCYQRYPDVAQPRRRSLQLRAASSSGGRSEAQAQQTVIDFLKNYILAGKSPMCGNSVCQDCRFLTPHMPSLETGFYYRNLDVSSLKELAKRWKPDILPGFKRAQARTALADIHESVDELLYYREHLIAINAICQAEKT
jgi:oligoribonuclease